MIKFFLLIIISVNVSFVNAQLKIEWQKCYGGTNRDYIGDFVISTSDGGFILDVRSSSNDGDITGNHGENDVCLLKLDKYGKIEWQKSYGGTQSESLSSLIQTSEGGYIFSATTTSNDGDVKGHNGSGGDQDSWIVKIDAKGSILWQKCFGDNSLDASYQIVEASDNGYIVSVFFTKITSQGEIRANQLIKINQNGEVEWEKNIEGSKIVKTTDGNYFICTGSNWSKDADIRYWKINQQGEILWEKKIGGSGTDFARDVQQTADGGCVITGVTFSNDGDVTGNHGNGDIWMVKVNASGNIEWQRCIGGSGMDENDLSVLTTNDGGYMITTVAYSVDGDFSGNYGNKNGDIWVAKLNKFGEIIWKKCIGGSGEDNPNTMIQSSDDSYLIYGMTNSVNGDVTGFKGGESDIWIVEIDLNGKIKQQMCLGGTNEEGLESQNCLFRTKENDFFVFGITLSNDNDVSGNHGECDIWVVKLTSKNVTNSLTEIINSYEKLTIYPNPANNKLTIQFNEPIIKITLIDILGNSVYTNYSGKKEYYIPENIQSGSYILEIDTPQGILHENIFINKN
jgi:hypothetical protein